MRRVTGIPWCIAALALAGSGAHAQVIQLTFEGFQDNEVIADFYNGGLAGSGSGPGPAFGVTFGSPAVVFNDRDLDPGGSGNFSGQPSGMGALAFLGTTNVFMNVAGGFTGGFSTFYTAVNQAGFIEIREGLNGTGALLATLDLPVTPSTPGDPPCAGQQGAFCPFVPVGLSFAGTARSIVFGGSSNQIGFDNVTFGSANPNTTVPEPTTWALLATGLGALALRRRRR